MAAFVIPQPIAQLPAGFALPVLPSMAFNDPREGKRYVPINIAWPGDGTTYELNVNGLGTQPLSQIVMLDIDNSDCGAPVTFFFPDSSFTLVIPGESGGLFPVFTGALRMYVAAQAALSSDITRFRILNYRQEPVALPPPQFLQIASALNLTGAGTTAILANTVSGTLAGYNAFGAFVGGAGTGTITATLVDHATSAVIDQAIVLAPPSSYVNTQIFNVADTSIRFSGGLDLVIAATGAPSININFVARYRSP